jgi:hypothetical protein
VIENNEGVEWPTTCPFCGQHHDAVDTMEGSGRVPEENDATMCFTCGEFCIFDKDGGLRKPTRREQRALDRDGRVQRARTAWAIIKANIPSRLRKGL